MHVFDQGIDDGLSIDATSYENGKLTLERHIEVSRQVPDPPGRSYLTRRSHDPRDYCTGIRRASPRPLRRETGHSLPTPGVPRRAQVDGARGTLCMMARAVHHVFTFAEYVQLEADSTVRHEFFGGRIWAIRDASGELQRIIGPYVPFDVRAVMLNVRT